MLRRRTESGDLCDSGRRILEIVDSQVHRLVPARLRDDVRQDVLLRLLRRRVGETGDDATAYLARTVFHSLCTISARERRAEIVCLRDLDGMPHHLQEAHQLPEWVVWVFDRVGDRERRVVLAWLEGLSGPRQVARFLGLDATQVRRSAARIRSVTLMAERRLLLRENFLGPRSV